MWYCFCKLVSELYTESYDFGLLCHTEAVLASLSETPLVSVSVIKSADRSVGMQCIVMMSLVAVRATLVSSITVCKQEGWGSYSHAKRDVKYLMK